MEYEYHHEIPRQDNYHKLQLLAEVFRIAYFGEDVVSGYDGYGQQGYAFGPARDVAAIFKQGIQFDHNGLYERGDRVHVASLQLGDDVYEFYAVRDQHTDYEAYPLDRALVDLNYVEYDRFPGTQRPVEEMIDAPWPVSFESQRLEVYKNLPSKYDLERGVSHDELGGILGAFVAGDFNKARRLSEESEIDIDELYDIEISHANEVDSNEIQFLAKLLSEQYFVAEKPPLQD